MYSNFLNRETMEKKENGQMDKFARNTGKINAMLSILRIDIECNPRIDSAIKEELAQEIRKINSLINESFDVVNELVANYKMGLIKIDIDEVLER
jgi:hypothetical protein